jgi:four helix bundle protein
MEEPIFAFEYLRVFKDARVLIKEVYHLQKRFPAEERYALSDQVRRAASSITANIAEGTGRTSLKEKIHFIGIAYGSLTETYCHLLTALDFGYLTVDDLNEVRPMFIAVAKMLSGLKKAMICNSQKSNFLDVENV